MTDSATLPLIEEPVARVRGEPLAEIPADLYIPPEALRVFLEAFEGPLDLLLYLIRKNSLDILDIPMAQLTRQYMEYVEVMRTTQLELAAEYLVMAAVLIEIKSRMLLPRPKAVEDDESDPRAELVRRLLEYEQMKQAAQKLDRLPQLGRDFNAVGVWIEQVLTQRLPDVHPVDLRDAWLAVLARARMNQHHRVRRDELSVREHMTRVLRRLRGVQFLEFADLFDAKANAPVVVVNFLAILELTKEGLIVVTQSEVFAPIYVRLSELELAA
jgi:segregation and condensation protein A